jgi:hypothetical protein
MEVHVQLIVAVVSAEMVTVSPVMMTVLPHAMSNLFNSDVRK